MPDAPLLFRAHSLKYLQGPTGIIANPNLTRDRHPRDMPPPVHAAIRQWFIERFGVDYRGAALFCTGDKTIAAGYKNNNNAIISLFPIGPFSVCYSPKCKDLYGHYLFQWSKADNPATLATTELDNLDFIHRPNGGIQEAVASGHEIMIFAEKFHYKIVEGK
ncbi:hypothetical protein [Achromobacter xylosoxidans]|uniref:hypothetical protein n=1 Tax=Alcaligenes xylosoxydans xylosoxydans TaxID=85698 RepID=UPI001040E975|nr:hypothetical protein [Achromobacter xylosoxidans]